MRSRLTPSPRLLHRLAFEAIGAPWSIETAEPVEPELAAAIDARIDSFDRTTYKLALGLLIALFMLSLVFLLAGVLSYSPLAILVSGAVSVGVSMLSSWGFQ